MGLEPLVTKSSSPGTSPTKENLSKHLGDLEILKALHTSKYEIIEHQLAATRDELATANRKIDEYKSKLVVCESLS